MEKKVSEKFISLKHFFPLKKVFCYCTELLTKFFKSLYFNRKMHAVFFFLCRIYIYSLGTYIFSNTFVGNRTLFSKEVIVCFKRNY